MPVALDRGGTIRSYREILETDAEILETTSDGEPVVVAEGRLLYVAGWLDPEAMRRLVGMASERAGLTSLDLPEAVRCRDTATERFWFNYATEPQRVGDKTLPPLSVTRDPHP